MQDMESFNEKSSLESFFEAWDEVLQEYRSSFSPERFRWLQGLSKNYYVTKVAVMNGYLMGIRDCGKPVGPLINLTQILLRELDNTE